MAYDEKMADTVRELIAATHDDVEEKRMFGGLCFMVHGKMCVCISSKNKIMIKIDGTDAETLFEQNGCSQMVHGGKVMTGFLYVDFSVITSKKQVNYWVQAALKYNRKSAALPTPKKTKKK